MPEIYFFFIHARSPTLVRFAAGIMERTSKGCDIPAPSYTCMDTCEHPIALMNRNGVRGIKMHEFCTVGVLIFREG